MSKEQLEKAKKAIKNNYPDERYSELRDALDYVISEAETVQQFAKKNIELNEFLNEYSEARHWGKNVIDAAKDIITEQDGRIEGLNRIERNNNKFVWEMIKELRDNRESIERLLNDTIDRKTKGKSIYHVDLIGRLESILRGDSDE